MNERQIRSILDEQILTDEERAAWPGFLGILRQPGDEPTIGTSRCKRSLQLPRQIALQPDNDRLERQPPRGRP